jgi:hypothetical protein
MVVFCLLLHPSATSSEGRSSAKAPLWLGWHSASKSLGAHEVAATRRELHRGGGGANVFAILAETQPEGVSQPLPLRPRCKSSDKWFHGRVLADVGADAPPPTHDREARCRLNPTRASVGHAAVLASRFAVGRRLEVSWRSAIIVCE